MPVASTKLIRVLLILSALFIVSLAVVAQDNPALAEADQALRYGDYQAAIAVYSAVANDSATMCEGIYGLGVSHLRAFEYQQSIAALDQYITLCEETLTVLVLRGQAHQALGNTEVALSDYERAIATRPSVLDSYLYEQMASLDPDRGILYLRQAAESPRNIRSSLSLREKLADAYLLVGSIDNALAQYDLILDEIDSYVALLETVEGAEFDESGSYRARIAYTAAQIELDNGNPQAGYARLQTIITNYPESSSALPALIDLIVGGQPVDLLIRMRINVRNENYFPVVDVLVSYLDNPANSANAPVELFLLLGQAQRGQGETNAALATFNRVLTEFADSPEASTALLEAGRTYEQLGDTAQALQSYLTLVNSYPDAPEIADALLAAASIQRTQGQIDSAIDLYRRVAGAFPEDEGVQESLFEIAYALPADQIALRAELFGLAGTSRGYLWQGKTLHQSGDLNAASIAWQGATATDSGSFFAMVACSLLTGVDLYEPSGTVQINPVSDTDRAEIEAWVATTFGLDSVTSTISPELENNPTLQRGIALWEVGLWSEARAEFDSLHTPNRNNPQALLQLAFYYRDAGINRSSLFSATRLVFASEQDFTQIPRGLLQLAYPVYFEDLLSNLAESYDLDPLLVASLVRQESSFDPSASSFAGATGLMQLMPATAQETASRIGAEDFVQADLLRPIVNAELGSFYLSSMLAFQNDSVPGALLSYNAGPGNALSWVNASGDDVAELRERITFNETRLYLELITENYMIYKYLYGHRVPACMFEGA